jgi:hypothetical protein
MSNTSADTNNFIWDMETEITHHQSKPNTPHHLKKALTFFKKSIIYFCNLPSENEKKNVSEIIDLAIQHREGCRKSAILTIRALSVDSLLPLDDQEEYLLQKKIIDLIENGFKDQIKTLELEKKKQTYEKILALKGFHELICSNLFILQNLPNTIEEIAGITKEIQNNLRHKLPNAYLQPYDWTPIKGSIFAICDQVLELSECKDATYKYKFDKLKENCTNLKKLCSKSPSFLTKLYAFNFAKTIESALDSLKEKKEGQFKCLLETRRKPPLVAEKRYALHYDSKPITITIPMINRGPGIAVNVLVNIHSLDNNSIAFETEELHLGDIPPGDFAITLKGLVVAPASLVKLNICASWNQLFGERTNFSFDLHLIAQSPNTNWTQLEQQDPYSLEVAEGDKFVGRKSKIQSIGNRLLKEQMSSTYITGQKRIGKTSLAQAVLTYIKTQAILPITYETFYLEWGEYCTANATSTLKSLGEQVYSFFQSHLPINANFPTPSFDGSLAPLNSIVKFLETTCPNKKFIIVLDEFDEIHPEMYRFGSLAETFFANLRTLAARKNLAFILVGGEKMPFIIGAQGDQLNKFVREPLDYFSRSEEWNDYVELIIAPVRNILNWEDSALNEIFNLTNGHPYYTKLLCAKIFSNAVTQRDTDIIVSDVKHALNGKIVELDTNSFAHFWKDGINAEREKTEVIELKRLRTLVAIGRAIRTGVLNKSKIIENSPNMLQPAEIGPIIEDFCRRDVMKDIDGELVMQLPIFQRWIRDVGVNKLISSTLADELQNEIEKANDVAYVKSIEIESLISNWPLYRGHEITSETVRAWLEQVSEPQEQRLLFIILQNLKFVSHLQISEKLIFAHKNVVVRATPPIFRESKVEKRRDLLVTYIDGPGKSGSAYARAYAKENNLLMDSVIEPGKAARRVSSENDRPSALVVVDDIAGTGRTIEESLSVFLNEIQEPVSAKKIPIFLIILFATKEAYTTIEECLKRYSSIDTKPYVCETLTDENRAFHQQGHGFWVDQQQHDRAKSLCTRLANGLYKESLGVGTQSLLIAFPDTCPNNNLPIIFASRSGDRPWRPLLARPNS